MPTAPNIALEVSSPTANPESDRGTLVELASPRNSIKFKTFIELFPEDECATGLKKKSQCGMECNRTEPFGIFRGDYIGDTLLEKTWSPYYITLCESIDELMARYNASIKSSRRPRFSARSVGQRTMRLVAKKTSGKDKSKSGLKGSPKIAWYYDEADENGDVNFPDHASVGHSSTEPLKSLSRDGLEPYPTMKIWDINQLHLSHGRFPAGGSDQSQHIHVFGLRTELETGDEAGKAVVEEEIVITGEPEILVGAPPEPVSHELRLHSFSLCPLFKKKFYFMAGPLARCGFILLRNEKIKCTNASCSAEHFLPDVLKRLSKEVVWHIAECHFSAARKPCTHCVGKHESGSECGKCGQTLRAERTFHHVATNPEQVNSQE